MIISNTNSALFERYSIERRHLNKLSNAEHVKTSAPENLDTSNRLTSEDSATALANYQSSYIFKDNLGFSANQARKQYTEYNNLEYREKISRSLGISVYA